MRDRVDMRRLGGLTALLLGLTMVFSSLTLTAVSRPGLAVAFLAAGAALSAGSLLWLRRGTP